MSYDEIIKLLNAGKIKELIFSIDGYSHYNNCVISCKKFKGIESIFVDPVKDGSESVVFIWFKENRKLFKLKKGNSLHRLTLKQVWDRVIIKSITYCGE